jgi:hypothetical protein
VKWAKLREKGHLHYVLFNGIVAWGLPMFFVMAVLPYFFGVPLRGQGIISNLLFGAVLWPVAGTLYGLSTWYFCEKYYLRNEAR